MPTAAPADLVNRLRASRRVLVVAHRPPDADGVGSLLALGRLLEGIGKDVTRLCAAPLDGALLALPGAEGVARAVAPDGRWDCAVLLDCASLDRAGLADEVLARADVVMNVDHHLTNPGFGDITYVDARAPATAALVVELFDALGRRLGPHDATCLYAGLLTDTDRFTAESATPGAHRLAARLLEAGAAAAGVVAALYAARSPAALRLLARAIDRLRVSADGRVGWIALDAADFEAAGVDPATAEDLVPVALGVEDVWVAAYLRPGLDGVRVGLRSRHPAVDVAAVAARFGGGGHRWAAGYADPDAVGAAERAVTALKEAVGHAGA